MHTLNGCWHACHNCIYAYAYAFDASTIYSAAAAVSHGHGLIAVAPYIYVRKMRSAAAAACGLLNSQSIRKRSKKWPQLTNSSKSKQIGLQKQSFALKRANANTV